MKIISLPRHHLCLVCGKTLLAVEGIRILPGLGGYHVRHGQDQVHRVLVTNRLVSE